MFLLGVLQLLVVFVYVGFMVLWCQLAGLWVRVYRRWRSAVRIGRAISRALEVPATVPSFASMWGVAVVGVVFALFATVQVPIVLDVLAAWLNPV